ncbi:hypothetical protein G6F46_005552 [Rhizopus delemar]|uniref:Reverse transcriptase domain-containing protein n=2 Tax=Rhizopus TaxID=4842 RepID=A0A9P7CKV3_9FUNG|nr:hypothetical protein G6F55_009006 [Rhizopus delemar]KAG1537971.1 hypothetical protein G6F51_010047 [Rhizopus arrhizus]KAG1492138.1 hypothetical protein G6F54_009521 [Rhizopus delemar]KAG1506395.1 hypothetical protein G6F53_009719 [Rhizopus delemar]KAG1521240.1 hypothetical protein G6F52_006924 [Rhizopus delemar]
MSLCGHIITTTISHKSHLFSPVTVSVLYAPASRKESQHLSSHHLRQAPKQWLQYIEDYFVDGVTPPDQAAQPTFCRGVQSSCIDFIFLSKDLPSVPRTANVTFIQPVWTDQFMVSIQLEYNPPPTDAMDHPSIGKGLWRANPLLASNKDFCAALKNALSNTVPSFIDGLSASYKWEALKATTKKKLDNLRKKKILFPEQVPELQPLVNVVERQLADIQQYHVEILALRSGIRWHELGELSAGYLKRTIATILCSSRADMLDAASTFYAALHSPDPVDHDAIESLLSDLPSSLRLSSIGQNPLSSPIDFDDILEGVSRCPSRSSPDTDGLPYELLCLIITHPECRDITLAVYNDALSHGIFPPSCARIISCVDDLTTLYQSGFLRDRFIADNAMLMKLVMDYAKFTNSKAFGLLLNQEKAYDQAHPDYLQKALTHFGFPPSFVQSVLGLFFGAQLRLNINGFLSNPVHQRWGLRQGDPLSLMFFNLAFEPLLRKILNEPLYNGFSTPRAPPSCISGDHLQPIKLLAYADDVLCLLKDPSDLTKLQTHLNTYSQASNAKFNFQNTEALSLSGSQITLLSIWHGPLLSNRISRWHDCHSANPVIYLGYLLYTSTAQLDSYLAGLLRKINTACVLHSHRSLSVRGRVTIVNSLILSKLWHALRVTSAPRASLEKASSVIGAFLTRGMLPLISMATLCLPRTLGGLGVLDPVIQQNAL